MSPAVGLQIPELSSSLGRIAVPRGHRPAWVALDKTREALLFDLQRRVSESRRLAHTDARGAAARILNGEAWRDAWSTALDAASAAVIAHVEASMADAAWRVRMPRRTRARLALTPGERRAVTARLGHGSRRFLASTEGLDAAAVALGRDRNNSKAIEMWSAALTRTARDLEDAWIALEGSVTAERGRWSAEVAAVMSWRPPLWPAFAIGIPLGAAIIWLGLVLGGYLGVPSWLGR